MTVSKYFNHITSTNEQSLYDSLVYESVQMTGFDAWYICRTDFEIDPILYEPKASVFDDSFIIEVNVPDNLLGWQGDGDIMSQFGFIPDEGAYIKFSKTRWHEIQKEREAAGKPYLSKPMEGDLFYFGYGIGSYANSLFQITHVDYNDSAWQLGNNFMYRMKVTNYRMTPNEKIELPMIPDLDSQLKEVSDRNIDNAQNVEILDAFDDIKVFNESNPFENV